MFVQSASGVEALSVAVKLPTNEEIGCLPLGRCCLLPVPLPMGRVFIYEVRLLRFDSVNASLTLRADHLRGGP